MQSTNSVRDFLHDVLADKAASRLTSQEFQELMDTAGELDKFSEKGIFILTMSEQLLKIANVNYAAVKKCMTDFMNGLKPEKVRRERDEDESPRRRRRRAAPQQAARAQDINGMVEESVSNPSNLEVVRGAASEPETISQKFSQNNDSRSSDENKRDFEFANQLNKISEGIEMFTNQELDHFPHQDADIEEISRASSTNSSQEFGLVDNLNQKLELLGRKSNRQNDREKKKADKTKVLQRTGARVMGTEFKKTVRKLMFDENLTLEKTRATLTDTTIEEIEGVPQPEWFNQYFQAEEQFLDTEQQFLEKLNEKPLSSLNNLMLSVKKERREMDEGLPGEFTQFDTGMGDFGDTVNDFTSQQIHGLSQQPDLVLNIEMNELNMFDFGTSSPTLEEISAKVNRPEALVFYEMLARMQNGDVEMNQDDVESFGEIKVKLLSHED